MLDASSCPQPMSMKVTKGFTIQVVSATSPNPEAISDISEVHTSCVCKEKALLYPP